MQEIEFAVLNAIQNLRCGFMDAIMVFFTTLGEWGTVWIALGVALLFFKKYRALLYFSSKFKKIKKRSI